MLTDGRTGQARGAIEGGEPILSRSTYANNRDVIDRLLYSSMYQGGRSIFQEGGILAAPVTTPSPDVIGGTRSSSEIIILTQKIDMLSAAYARGKRILIGEKEAELFNEVQSSLETDKTRRAL